MKIFGNKRIGVDYFICQDAYAVIFKNQARNEIGLIRVHG
jgi:8-oxo-dGTP diphosphatase